MFIPIRYDSGKLQRVGVATGVAVVKGAAMVDNGSGYLTLASAGGNADIRFVAMETVTTTADGQLVLMVRTEGTQFIADTDANPAQTDVGTEADLASASTIDPDASVDDVFYIEAIYGAASNRQVIGTFTLGVPNS